jgi:hypothetical protein
MPKRSSSKKPRPTEDENQAAYRVLREVIEKHDPEAEDQPEKNPAAVALGRLGGKKGGPARARKLSAKRRAEIARKAAKSRWSKSGN